MCLYFPLSTFLCHKDFKGLVPGKAGAAGLSFMTWFERQGVTFIKNTATLSESPIVPITLTVFCCKSSKNGFSATSWH